jgi:hypothetical protein
VSASSRPPIPPKPVALFAAHALVLALLIGWWPSARAVYPAVFRAHAAALFASGDPPAIQLRPASGAAMKEEDTFVEAYAAQGDEPRWRLGISSLRLGYWPMAVLLALLLATPMSAPRRALAVAVGLVWLDAFALGRLGLDIQRSFAELASRGASDDASGALLAYRTASKVLNSNIVMIAAVLLGWAALARPRRALEMGSLARVLDQRARPPG